MSEVASGNKVKDLINLAIYHNGTEMATSYTNMIMERFSNNFSKILLISEDDENLETLRTNDKLSVITFLKPVNNGSEWLMILEPGEIPSLQLMNNLKDIVSKAPQDTNILCFPVVLCDHESGDILELMPPISRIFRQKPQLSSKEDMDEIILEDFPIIKFKLDI